MKSAPVLPSLSLFDRLNLILAVLSGVLVFLVLSPVLLPVWVFGRLTAGMRARAVSESADLHGACAR